MFHARKKQVDTEEHKFLKSFLETDFFASKTNSSCSFEIIEEPFSGFGYPDVVGVIYNKKAIGNWKSSRNKLKKDDIKILHYLYMKKKGVCPVMISSDLGFSLSMVEKTVRRLVDADVAFELKDKRIKNKPLRQIFHVEEIVSIEAKLKDWKGAFGQSLNNSTFSSFSYSLFPESVISDKVLDVYNQHGLGLITYNKSYSVVSKPDKIKIPNSIGSWYFNEYVGRLANG